MQQVFTTDVWMTDRNRYGQMKDTLTVLSVISDLPTSEEHHNQAETRTENRNRRRVQEQPGEERHVC